MDQKGFINIIMVIGIIILVGTIGYFVLNQQMFTSVPPQSPNPTPIPTPIPTSTSTPKPATQLLPWDPNKIYFYYNENNYKDELKFLRLGVGGEPIFRSSYQNGELMLGNKFYLKLKDNATLQDLQKLNQKYNIILEKEQYGFYIISVKNNLQTNALEMANAYHDEPIIQWAMPLWSRKYDLR